MHNLGFDIALDRVRKKSVFQAVTTIMLRGDANPFKLHLIRHAHAGEGERKSYFTLHKFNWLCIFKRFRLVIQTVPVQI